MELAQLRYLVAVADERNFTRAAERCHVTQQSLSAAVARLERAVGVTLVQRTTRRVTLTPAGEAFAVRARRALAEADAAAVDAQAVATGLRGRLTLGFHGPGADVAAPVLDRVRQQLPDLRIDLRRVDFTDPTAGVFDGTTDLGLVAAPLRHRDLANVAVLREPMVVVVADNHPLTTSEQLTLDDLRQWPIAEMPNPHADALVRQWNTFWTLQRIPNPPSTTPVDFTGVEEWLAAHRHATWFSTGPASAARLYPAAGITWMNCVGLPACTWQLYHRRNNEQPALTRLIEAVRASSPSRNDQADAQRFTT